MVELENREKLDNESWADYDSLSQLVSRVFPEFQDMDQEQLALNYFINQLKRPTYFASSQSYTLQEAVSISIEK